jgi:D-lactate dehydrogenase (cytochrome)
VPDDCRLPADDFLFDAAHFPGGHAAGITFPRSVEEIREALAGACPVLPIGAQSSLTGGATPMGELILATSRMARILEVAPERITVEPGVTVAAMQEALARVGAWFPPAPTFTGACAGGIAATNAAGAATFKYGSTREWIEGMTVVLADGTVLDLRRGAQRAQPGMLEIPTPVRTIRVPLPTYRMPNVAKRSAGYFAAPDMDLIDLFIGSEGTLGVIARVTFRAASPVPQVALALVRCPTEQVGLALVRELRSAARTTWASGDPSGLDVAAIEHMDQRSLEVLREDGADVRHGVAFPRNATLALLIQLELPFEITAETAYAQMQNAPGYATAPTPLVRFCRTLERLDLLDATELALPEQTRRMADLLAIREAVPTGVNQRIGTAQRTIDARIEKTAADMIVPFDHFAEMMEIYRAGFSARGLDYAVWGHISDGNVHPNVIPRSFADVLAGKEAILEFGRAVSRLGGCPLAEHGVGRNPIKQTLLRELYGEAGIEQMRSVKRALDPDWKLAPGVIFEKA